MTETRAHKLKRCNRNSTELSDLFLNTYINTLLAEKGKALHPLRKQFSDLFGSRKQMEDAEEHLLYLFNCKIIRKFKNAETSLRNMRQRLSTLSINPN